MNRVWIFIIFSAWLMGCTSNPKQGVLKPYDHQCLGQVQTLDIQGMNIAYIDMGVHNSKTLIFIHPWAGNMDFWKEVVPAFKDQYRIVLMDLPGHGMSSKGGYAYSVELAGQVVHALMLKLGIQRGVFIGNSMGGATALEYVGRWPEQVEALVLIDALGVGEVPWVFSIFIENYFKAPAFCAVPDPIFRWFTELFVFGHDTREEIVDQMLVLRDSPEGWAWSKAVSAYLRSAVHFDATPWLGEIKVPTLVIWGSQDWVLWPYLGERLANAIPHAQLKVLDGCGHMPEVERPRDVVQSIGVFLESL